MTVLAKQTLLSTKPLPDLYLCCDIWTPLNRSNSTKEWWKMAELEDKRKKRGMRAVRCQCREVTVSVYGDTEVETHAVNEILTIPQILTTKAFSKLETF